MSRSLSGQERGVASRSITAFVLTALVGHAQGARALDPPILSFTHAPSPVAFGQVLAAHGRNRNEGDWTSLSTPLDPVGDLFVGEPFHAFGAGQNEGRHAAFRGRRAFQVFSTSGSASTVSDARLGSAFAVGDFDGDGEFELAVGAPGSLADGKPAGTVSVGGFDWHQDVPGVVGHANAGDRFGEALAVGNFNGDLYDDLAIGVPGKDLGGIIDAGAIVILFGSASGLTGAGDIQTGQDLLPTVAAETDDEFGAALAAGDLNGDGKDDLVVGTPHEGVTGQVRAGSIHILYGSSGALVDGDWWNQSRGSVPGSAEHYDEFGKTLWMADFNGDGRDDLAIGVPGENTSGGMVQIFDGAPGGFSVGSLWSQGTIGLSALEPNERFGAALTSGDFDDDGYQDLAIGAPGETVAGLVSSGSVHVIYGSGSGLTSAGAEVFDRTHPEAAGPGASDQFGHALAATDLDGNGGVDLAVGAPYEGVGAGRVYILSGGDSMCDDGRDNDLDGLVDLEDPDCTSTVDPFEGGYPNSNGCDDGLDTDWDGLADADDPGCYDSAGDRDERSEDAVCDNGLDDDGDGRSDVDVLTRDDPLSVAGFGDPACSGPTFSTETTACQDGVDNDNDGRTDFDGGQSIHGACTGGVCPPGVTDTNSDGIADADPNCGRPWRNKETATASTGCGIGPELLPALTGLLWLAGRRRGLGPDGAHRS